MLRPGLKCFAPVLQYSLLIMFRIAWMYSLTIDNFSRHEWNWALVNGAEELKCLCNIQNAIQEYSTNLIDLPMFEILLLVKQSHIMFVRLSGNKLDTTFSSSW